MKADAIKIADGTYWVGVIDWDLRDYHGYTLKGTTYNCYLVFGEDKVALIDNTFPGTSSQLWGRIEDAFVQEGKKGEDVKIDVVIQNHIESDHSGSLVEVVKKFPEVLIYCSKKAIPGLKNAYTYLENANMESVGTGDTLDIGGKTFAFLDAPMLHWPDSMFSLCVENGILFSNDAFGQHLALSERFDHEVNDEVLMGAAKKFYANLLTMLSPMILRKFDEVKELGLLEQIKMIAPSHGQIWTDPMKIINAYTDWATGVCEDKVTFIYDTMHHSTQKMAHAMAEGVMSEGVETKLYFLHADERSEIVTDILDSKAIFVGSPTMMNNPFPSLGDIMYYLSCLSFDKTTLKRKAVVFGSKGWGGGALRKLTPELENAGFEVVDSIETTYVPTKEVLDECYELGKKVAKEIKGS
ncbi:MAG: FprA family A-type flavoprotein [Methanobacteriaceae archaeon]